MSLIFPSKILSQHVAVLGKTGSGKSSALRYMVEYLLDQEKRVCIIDPKGDWHGLKVAADGIHHGYPVIAFGAFKDPRATDVPISPHSGKQVAELIATGNRPCIVGFRGWMQGEMTRFWIDFASTLFKMNEGDLYLVIDEVHNFAAKGKIMDIDAGKCLHWTNRLMSEGRGLGITALIASQRPQKVHNDTLTSCETLIAMRVIHEADRRALKEWIDGCGDKVQGNEVLSAVANMPRGDAFVWSPEVGFGPTRLHFPMFRTFDSFAPPQLQKKVHESGWSTVNLDEVKIKLAAVIEEQKANDPKELKAEVALLKKQLARASAAQFEIDPAIFAIELARAASERDKHWYNEFAKVTSGVRAELVGVIKVELTRLCEKLDAASNHKLPEIEIPKVMAVMPPVGLPITRDIYTRDNIPSNSLVGKSETRILTVLAQRPEGCALDRLAILSGYSPNGHFSNILGKLRSNEYISPPRVSPITITHVGRDSLGYCEPLPTGRELQTYWLSKLGAPESRIMTILFEERRPLGLPELAALAGYSPNGHFSNILGLLRRKGLITPPRQPIQAADGFFED